MINARNIKHVELLEQEPFGANGAANENAAAASEDDPADLGIEGKPAGPNIKPEDMIREFAMGDQSRMDQKRILIAMEQRIEERK